MDKRLRFMTDLIEPLMVPPGSTVRLSRDHDPGYTGGVARPQAGRLLADGVDLLAEYQDRLAAQDTYGVLLVLEGLDASGKDRTIKHVMSGVKPQGGEVRGFKQASTRATTRGGPSAGGSRRVWPRNGSPAPGRKSGSGATGRSTTGNGTWPTAA